MKQKERIKKIEELSKKYVKDLVEIEELANEIGREIVKICKPVIKDIEYSLGWDEAGIDTLCFFSDSHSILHSSDKTISDFEKVIVEAFPILEGHIDCPFGILLLDKEIKKIKNRLKKEEL